MSAIEQVTESVVKKVILDAGANLSRAPQEGGTPVDTGWARANWIASVGKPVGQPVGDPESGVEQANAAQQAGIGAVLGYKLAFGPVYLTNNVPYILRLNDGHSQQASSGFVQRAITEAVFGIKL